MEENFKCHPSCKNSKNVGPFAGCKCRCGGKSHASATLAGMDPASFRAAQRQMASDVKLGGALMQARVFLASRLRAEAERNKRRSA